MQKLCGYRFIVDYQQLKSTLALLKLLFQGEIGLRIGLHLGYPLCELGILPLLIKGFQKEHDFITGYQFFLYRGRLVGRVVLAGKNEKIVITVCW